MSEPNNNGQEKSHCPVCGGEFTPKRWNQIYDDPKCGTMARMIKFVERHQEEFLEFNKTRVRCKHRHKGAYVKR